MPISLQESKALALLRSVAAQRVLHAEVEGSFRQLAQTRNVFSFSIQKAFTSSALLATGLSIVLSQKSTSCVHRSREYMECMAELQGSTPSPPL